jgi:putative Mg2+ transporter-C (MgtC) family protein
MDSINFFAMGPLGREWSQITDILLAFALASLIGFEREMKMKSAGLRTHALVGLGAALLMLVSKYGFTDVLVGEHLRLDPSRIAAQIVSGIGFIGGGLIFVRRDIVHGLTTAATIWLTAAIGMACGAGMYLLACVACGGYFIDVFGYTLIMNRLRGRTSHLRICYRAGHDTAATIFTLCAAKDFSPTGFTVGQPGSDPEMVSVELHVHGKTTVESLIHDISALPSIISVTLNPSKD